MSYDKEIVSDTLSQIREAIDNIKEWSREIKSGDDFVTSSDGMRTLAAVCMLLEAIGEGVKKIDKRTESQLLRVVCPEIPWKNIMGMRDHIAHGYFNIDADFVFDVVNSDLEPLKEAVEKITAYLKEQ